MGQRGSVFVSRDIRERLENCAKSESDLLWEIADCSFVVWRRYQNAKRKYPERFENINDYDIWREIGLYCRKGPSRVKRIFEIGLAFDPYFRTMFGDWEFGYFERTAHLEPGLRVEVFEFLRGCLSGELLNPPRRLGVGEFMMIFESQIHGLQKENVQAGVPAIDLGMIVGPNTFFQDILYSSSKLEHRLTPHIDKPSVKEVLGILAALKRLLPGVMRDIGMEIPVENEERVAV